MTVSVFLINICRRLSTQRQRHRQRQCRLKPFSFPFPFPFAITIAFPLPSTLTNQTSCWQFVLACSSRNSKLKPTPNLTKCWWTCLRRLQRAARKVNGAGAKGRGARPEGGQRFVALTIWLKFNKLYEMWSRVGNAAIDHRPSTIDQRQRHHTSMAGQGVGRGATASASW